MKFTVIASVMLLCGFAGGWITRNPGNFNPSNDAQPIILKSSHTPAASAK